MHLLSTSIVKSFGRLLGSRNGNILITSALALPVVIGMVALVVEYGGAVLNRVENQRVADLAAYAGAVAYGVKNTETSMQDAAHSVGLLNGVPASQMSVSLVASPRTATAKSVLVTIATPQNMFLSRVISDVHQFNVRASSYAELGSGTSMPGCILALSASDTGVTMSGGTELKAPKCAVSSNNTVTVPCGTKITALAVNYNSTTAPSQPCSGIVSPSGGPATITKTPTTDPLAGNAAVTAATARFATKVATNVVATMPTVTAGTNISFAWDQNATKNAAIAMGCTATWAQPIWTFACPAAKTSVDIGTLTLGGGISVNFAIGGAASVTYNFSGLVNNSGATLNFGPGTYNMTKGLQTGGGSTTSFGAGTFRIGKSATSCNGSYYSICHTGTTLTFGGPSIFELPGGFYNNGGSTLNFGSGSSNSYKIGPASSGNAIVLGGGSKTLMADATGGTSVFEIVGNVDGGGGGSCFVIAAAQQHDIAGNMVMSGAILLGAGVYTVDGYVSFGAAGGGGASCNGSTISVKGTDVSLVISGKAAPTSGSCNGFAFCVAAGYSGVTLLAPQTGTMAKLAVIGPQSTTVTKGATFAEGGSSGQVSGAFYFPNGPITMTGGAGISGNDAYCLQLIGSKITLSGGTTAASECIASSSASAKKKIVLVQ